MKVQFNQTYFEKYKRIKNLPLMYNECLSAIYKIDAINFIKEFQNGIKREELGMRKLSRMTTQIKKDQGLSQPETPLYGKGLQEKNSLINAHTIRKLKNGWSVKLRKAKHHTKSNLSNKPHDISLDKLVMIHENGATIPVNDKTRALFRMYNFFIKKTTAQFRLPPRPARLKAYNKVMTKRLEQRNNIQKLINEAIKWHLNNNNILLKRIFQNFNKGKEFEFND